MSDLWSCTVIERAPISGWRDPNALIREMVFDNIRWWAHKKLVPAKDIGKSLPKVAKNQDVVIAAWKGKPKSKIKLPDLEKITSQIVLANEMWLRAEIYAELGLDKKPGASLAYLKLEVRQVHPDAPAPDYMHERAFLVRMLSERSLAVRALYPTWLDMDFDPEGSKSPPVVLIHEFAKRPKKATSFVVDVIAEKRYLDEIPDAFDSTAF